MRFGAFFVGLCMVVIAAALGAAAYLTIGLSDIEAAAVALTVLSLLSAYSAFAGRRRDRAELSHQITELSRGTTDLAHQVGDLGRRVVALEGTGGQNPARPEASTDALAEEIEVLGTLVKQLAESVAAHELALLEAPVPMPTAPLTLATDSVLRFEPPAPQPQAVAAAAPPADPGERVPQVRAALEANRLDLYLQPIVTLPQRKVRFYEVFTRLRDEDGALLAPADYLPAAEAGGLMPMLDNLVILRAVQVVRRLTAKNREVGLFCNIAASTLADAAPFAQFLDFLTANRALASSLVLEFPQAALREMGPIEQESLAQLAGLGFRFSIDHVDELQIEPRALAEQGVRYVKVAGPLLLGRDLAGAGDIHPSDLPNLLARYGIELIAEKIESESTVVDLLDHDVRFGQGFLFAAPKLVREAALPASGARVTPLPQAAQASAADPQNRERITANLMQLARNMARRA
jgi:cyclic-di-GMP phosphodiesterase TipF (flagellum assembly factor)